jgi:NAD(P)-dependent dehydrogenase (short-subunit alcohol dehydrogenase family)
VGISAFVDGTRIELKRKGIAVTDVRPGYIESEMNDRIGRNPLLAKAETGARALAKAIEAERARAYAPAWPWVPLSVVMRVVPAALLRKFT